MNALARIPSDSITEREFNQIRNWLYDSCGIYLNDSKKTLVSGRLSKRLRELHLPDIHSYTQLLLQQPEEQQIAVNLLTTNETYFFREAKHFDFIETQIVPLLRMPQPRIWSAAASSGEEAYSLAMLLSDKLSDRDWQVLATDINTEVLMSGYRGVYPLHEAEKIPPQYLKRFCVKGKGSSTGFFMLKPEIKKRVVFKRHNLMKALPDNPVSFDLILLRNVLIYFELKDKQLIIQNVLRLLKPGGWLLVGHSESINGYDERLIQKQAGCYQFRP